MIVITKYSTVKAAYFECLIPPRITIAAHQSIEEVFGFNLSHWSTQLSRYSRQTSVDATMVGSGGAKKEGKKILAKKQRKCRPFPAQQNKLRGRPITPSNSA